MRHIVTVLPSIGFGIIKIYFIRVKRFKPSVSKAPSHKLCMRVKYVLIILSTLNVGFINF